MAFQWLGGDLYPTCGGCSRDARGRARCRLRDEALRLCSGKPLVRGLGRERDGVTSHERNEPWLSPTRRSTWCSARSARARERSRSRARRDSASFARRGVIASFPFIFNEHAPLTITGCFDLRRPKLFEGTTKSRSSRSRGAGSSTGHCFSTGSSCRRTAPGDSTAEGILLPLWLLFSGRELAAGSSTCSTARATSTAM